MTASAVKVSKRSPRKWTGRYQSSIDEMASRLLDDSNSSLKERDIGGTQKELPCQPTSLANNPPESTTKPPFSKCPSQRKGQTHIAEPFSPLSPLSPLSPRKRNLRADKQSQKNVGKVIRQNSAPWRQADSYYKRKENGLQKLATSTNTLNFDPLKSHPIINLKASTSVPLGHVNGNVGHRKMDGGADMVTAMEHDGPEQINQKLCAMLAATDELKPSTSLATNSPATKLTRMVSSSKMFAKVSHAWDRLHPKTSFENPKDRERGEVQIKNEQENMIINSENQPLHSPMAMSPISTIEIRLNEGDNLNKRKVQRIVGGQVARKPVADDGKSLRNRKSLDDPFSGSDMARTPTSFETRLKKGAENDDSTLQMSRNPFESEKEFDNNIEDRILSITPVGSSTPRIKVDRAPTPDPDGSPITRHLMSTNPYVDSMLDGVAVKLGREELTQARLLPFTSVKANERRLIDSRNRLLLTAAPKNDPAGADRVKKHPSPSKEALEDLEQAFRKYTSLKTTGAELEEVDELATSFVSLTPPLPSRDKNRLGPNRLSVSNIDDLINHSLYRGLHRSRSSSPAVQYHKGPRSVEGAFKRRGEIRLAPSIRGAGVCIDDVDELH